MFETAGENNLEHIPTQAVGNSLTDICFMLFIGQWGSGFTNGTEIVGGVIAVIDGFLHRIQFTFFTGGKHFKKYHFVLKVVEDNEVLIQDVEHVRCVVGGFAAIFYGNIFKIAYGIERGVAIKTAVIGIFAFHMEAAEEIL